MKQPRISLVHTTGNPNSRNAALGLGQAGFLHEVITTFGYGQDGLLKAFIGYLPKTISQRLEAELSRRTWIVPPGAVMKNHPWREVIRVVLQKIAFAQRLGLDQNTLILWLCTALDHHVAKHHLQGLDAIYSYEDIAATTFQTAKKQGIQCLYELPIVFYRTSQAIQTAEAERFPELASALQAAQEPLWKLKRKDQEVQLANHIFVASSFTKQSLREAGVATEKISVIPYGAPTDYFQPRPKPDSCFRALYVGQVSPRKGIQYLLQAWQALQLSVAELLLVGVNCFPQPWLSPYKKLFRHIPSVPHHDLNQYYSLASVFVFPSLVEGFGLVLLEAMACGIPVITTPHTAGPDILTDGVEGFIVPIRDVDALKEKLEWCYCHPSELAEMGRAARCQAEQLTWDLYRQRLATQVKAVLTQTPSL